MTQAKRAAQADAEEATVAELGLVGPARRAGRRAAPRAASRLVVAPLAVLSVVGLAAGLMFLSPSDSASDTTDPVGVSTAALGNSRDLIRPELFSATPSPTPSATLTPTPTPSPALTPSATPSATASAAAAAAAPAKAATTAAPDYTTLGTSAGTRYATSSVNVRTGPGTGFDAITTLADGDSVAITGRQVDGWRQVVVGKKAGWIKESLLSATKPAAKATASSDAPAAASSSSVDTSASCAKAGDLESHLTARTAKVLRAVCAKFDGVSSYGGYRPGAGSYHGSGQAIDIMVSGDYGWEIAKWARANASELGVIEVLYSQKIWTTQRSGEGWRTFSDRGGATANHYDHVHLSVR